MELPMPASPEMLETLTISPLPEANSASLAARAHWNAPIRLTDRMRIQSSVSTASRSECRMNAVVAALLTKTSNRPNSRTAVPTIFRQAASSATSASTAIPLTPSAAISAAVSSASFFDRL
jgi:hypothetical protein